MFTSPLLRKNLEGANKVFPYIITVGPELERVAAEQGDLLKQFYLGEIANRSSNGPSSRRLAWSTRIINECHRDGAPHLFLC